MSHVFRSLVIRFLAFWNDLSLKQVGARAGIEQKDVSRILGRDEIKDDDYERLLSAVARRPAEVEIVTGCLENLEELKASRDLTPEEQVEVEIGIREETRLLRSTLLEAVRTSRARPEEIEADDWYAEVLWSLMKEMTEGQQLAVVRVVRACRSGALLEKICAESESQASRDVERAAFLARLAREIAKRIEGPEEGRRHDQDLRRTHSGALGAAAGVEPTTGVGGSTCGTTVRVHPTTGAAGVHPATGAAGVHPATGVSPDGREKGNQRGREDDGQENRTHRVVSVAAPAAGLRGPRGPRLAGMVRQSGAKNPTLRQVDKPLSLKQRLVRLARALSGKSQKAFGESTGVGPNMLALYEVGDRDPSSETVQRLTEGAGLTVPAAEEVLRFADALRRPRRRAGLGAADLFTQLEALGTRFLERLLRLPMPDVLPRAEDREGVEALWAELSDLVEDQQVAVVRVGREFQNWALAEWCCAESENQASRQIERAASLARLAGEIADRCPGPEGWRLRLRGYVAAHPPNIERVLGHLPAAREGFEEAKKLWLAGSDPGGLLDAGRLLDLEASLCRDERDLGKSLALLDEAFLVGRCKGRILVKKGFTLEVMGDSERAIETLLQAMPRVERDTEARLWYKLRANLGVSYTHAGRFADAADLVQQARPVAAELGDEIDLIRLSWLEGRILAGLGQPEEAGNLLTRARQDFTTRGMWYDVALADLEIAILLLAESRTAEVQEMARELVAVFEAKGVHREALAALRLFQEAADRKEATAELARQVLRYLFRARFDERLRFNGA